jgi:hypothetical protein
MLIGLPILVILAAIAFAKSRTQMPDKYDFGW